jgi:hypothetical protein
MHVEATMAKRLMVLAAWVVTMAATAGAQTTFTHQVPPPPGGEAGTRVFLGIEGGAPLVQPGLAGDLLFVEPLDAGGPVTDAPYTAEAVTETMQTLADGNRITRRSSVHVARDSRGRERREHQAMMFGPTVAQRTVPLVTISDPAGGTAITLDHQRQVATRMQMRRWSGAAGTGVAFAASRAIAAGPANAGSPPIATAPMAGTPAAVGGATMSWTMAAPTNVVMATPEATGERTTVTLEPQTIEGLRAEGMRTTVTIPAGALGNERPIEIVHERWYSPELKTVLVSRRYDPRFGETTFRLVGVARGEPAAELFEIPPGYTIEEPKLPPLPR